MKILEVIQPASPIPQTAQDINPHAMVDLGVLYRGVESGTDARRALRYFTAGDLGDGIYFTHQANLAASYGGGPNASVAKGTRVVHAYQVMRRLFPEEVTYLFGGARYGEPVSLYSGNGVEVFSGRWMDNAMIAAARQSIAVIGTPDSIGINQVAIHDASIIAPLNGDSADENS